LHAFIGFITISNQINAWSYILNQWNIYSVYMTTEHLFNI